MHILFLSDNFPPEGNAPATRTYEHVREWVKKGHKVTVITCAPNFPEGKVFDGYENKWLAKTAYEGIDVWRVKTYITANEGFLKRTLDFISFMLSSFIFGLFTKKVDVVIGTSPQFFTVNSAWALAKLKRIPFVFELRDIWPASITAVGAMKKSKVISVLEKIEMFLYRQADLIVSVTNSFKTELVERNVDENKIEVVLNGVDLSKYAPAERKAESFATRFSLEDKFVVGYIGTHGLAHALDKVIEAAQILEHKAPDIAFVFAGGGAAKPQIEKLVEENKLSNVVMIDRQPKEKMPELWSLCDVSLISLKDTPLFKTVIPSKIFESMGMGLPMIFSGPLGEASDIISQSSSGVIVKPEDPDALAEAILDLWRSQVQLKTIKSSSYQAAQQYDRRNLSLSMLAHITNLVERKK